MRYLPFLDLRGYSLRAFRRDILASPTVTFLDIPQGIAYALIAGLPPAMGLYAAAVPAIVGALFRSSRHVVTGPTNALSLLVGSAVAGEVARGGASPMEVGVTLAVMVGILQILAGLLRLSVLVDYISHPVVRGYIAGAAVLIAIGQLSNATGTIGSPGKPAQVLYHWFRTLPSAEPLAVGFAAGTVALILAIRRLRPNVPASILALGVGIIVSGALHLHDIGLRLVSDLAPMPSGLPPLTLPALDVWRTLFPAAVACSVLSLVESSSVARALAARTGQRLDLAEEFAGQGLANLAAGFFGGYPVSGSLSRSAMNLDAGAQTRLSGLFCGTTMLAVLVFLGPLVNRTPIASLAGLLFVLAADLVDREQIRLVMRGTLSDRATFIITLVGTWTLPLDQAIYLGVGISILVFLRHARLLNVREMAPSQDGQFHEPEPGLRPQPTCTAIRILDVTGAAFFAAAGELQSYLDRVIDQSGAQVLILRLRQAQDVDITTAKVLEAASQQFRARGGTLILLGLRPPTLRLLESVGTIAVCDPANVFPAEARWFVAMQAALERALGLVGSHSCGAGCPVAHYVEHARRSRR